MIGLAIPSSVLANDSWFPPVSLKSHLPILQMRQEVHDQPIHGQPEQESLVVAKVESTKDEPNVQGPGVKDTPLEESSNRIEDRFPGVRIPAKPKDLIPRTGGSPLSVPDILENPPKPRAQAILQRQRIMNRLNPAIGVVFETIAGYTQRRQRFVGGVGQNAGAEVGTELPPTFSTAFRTVELFASAEVDPFARAYVIAAAHPQAINQKGTNQFGGSSFSIEEGAMQTTSLPFNFSVRGGRFFADWGYLGRRHLHDLPQIDLPPSLAHLFGENQTDGVEVTWLAPTPFFLQFTGAWGSNFGGPGDQPLANFIQQPVQGNTVYGSMRTYHDINDDNNIEVGFSALFSPRSRVPNAQTAGLLAVDSKQSVRRSTFDLDVHYRWYPLGRGLRQSFSFHGEVLYDYGQGRRDIFGNTVSQGAWGGYGYVEYRISKQWRPGFRVDYHQALSEPALVKNPFTGKFGSTVNRSGNRTDALMFSPYITYYPSEFQRFILQYNHSNYGNTVDPNNQVLLQWEVVIGSHQHGFTERD